MAFVEDEEKEVVTVATGPASSAGLCWRSQRRIGWKASAGWRRSAASFVPTKNVVLLRHKPLMAVVIMI